MLNQSLADLWILLININIFWCNYNNLFIIVQIQGPRNCSITISQTTLTLITSRSNDHCSVGKINQWNNYRVILYLCWKIIIFFFHPFWQLLFVIQTEEILSGKEIHFWDSFSTFFFHIKKKIICDFIRRQKTKWSNFNTLN